MNIFTCSFSQAKALDPDRYLIVSISRRSPRGFSGYRCSVLAPSAGLLDDYHHGLSVDDYSVRYRQEIAAIPDLRGVFASIAYCCHGRDMVLCCYEKAGAFCHRHLLSDIVYDRFGYRINELS